MSTYLSVCQHYIKVASLIQISAVKIGTNLKFCLKIISNNLYSSAVSCINLFVFSNYRVVSNTGKESDINGQKFCNFGAHHDAYPCSYLTAAAAIGMTQSDVDTFISRLNQVLTKCHKARETVTKCSDVVKSTDLKLENSEQAASNCDIPTEEKAFDDVKDQTSTT